MVIIKLMQYTKEILQDIYTLLETWLTIIVIFPYKLPYFIKMMRFLGLGSYGLSYGWKVLKVSLESKLGLYICNKGLSIKIFLNCVFSGGIYQIKLETIIWISEQFSSKLLVHVHYLFSINLSYVWVIYIFSYNHLCTSCRLPTKSPRPGV